MSEVRFRELVSVRKRDDIRFLTLISTLTRGGTERTAVNYALGYHRAGFPSAVLAYGGAGPRLEILEKAGIPVFVGGDRIADIERASEEAKAWAPDILHLHRPGIADFRSASALRLLIHPRLRVFETNVFGYVDRSPDRLLIDLHLQLSRWCLWKWTQSASDLLVKSPSVVLPYSSDGSQFRPADLEERSTFREAVGIPETAFVFGRVGQASMTKWSPALIKAFHEVAQSSANVWLAVCGLPEELRILVSRLPESIRSRVVELPVVDNDSDLRRYYSLMDVFVHVSQKGESFGMVLCEAMLCGIPVITMSTPLRDNSQVEVVPNRKVGIVASNQREFVDAMVALLNKDGMLQSMRREAPTWACTQFCIDVVTRRLLALASLALESNSIPDLSSRLAALDGFVSEAHPGTYREILKSAGVRQSLVSSLGTSLINRPFSRRIIDLLGDARRLFH